jgi:hypothetical protein
MSADGKQLTLNIAWFLFVFVLFPLDPQSSFGGDIYIAILVYGAGLVWFNQEDHTVPLQWFDVWLMEKIGLWCVVSASPLFIPLYNPVSLVPVIRYVLL